MRRTIISAVLSLAMIANEMAFATEALPVPASEQLTNSEEMQGIKTEEAAPEVINTEEGTAEEGAVDSGTADNASAEEDLQKDEAIAEPSRDKSQVAPKEPSVEEARAALKAAEEAKKAAAVEGEKKRAAFVKKNKKEIEKRKRLHAENIDEKVRELADKYEIRVAGIYVKSLKNDFEYSMNPDLTRYNGTFGRREGYFYSASVVKLFQSFSIVKMAMNGKVDIKKRYTDPVTDRRLTVDYDLRKMIIYSDNDRYAGFLRIFGVDKINGALKANGLKYSKVLGEVFPAEKASDYLNKVRYGTAEQGGRITPRETARLIEMIYMEPHKYMDIVREAMKKTTTGRNRIRRALSSSRGEALAHKTGTGRRYNAVNDVGYVMSPSGDYIIVILSMGNSASGIYEPKDGQPDYEIVGERFISNVAKAINKEMTLVHGDTYIKETRMTPFGSKK